MYLKNKQFAHQVGKKDYYNKTYPAVLTFYLYNIS